MTNRKEKTQCVSWFIETKSVSQTQLNYKSIYAKEPPSESLILKWHKTFIEAGTFADKDDSKIADENDAICTDIKQEIITEDACSREDQDESLDSPNAETSTRIKIEEPSDDEDVKNDLVGQSSYTQDEIHLYPVEIKQEIKMEDNADEYSEEADINKDDIAEDQEIRQLEICS